MVRRHQDREPSGIEPVDLEAHRRLAREIERALCRRRNRVTDPLPSLRLFECSEVVRLDVHGFRREEMDLGRTARIPEGRTQDLVAPHDLADRARLLQGIGWPRTRPDCHHVVGGVRGIQAMKDPKSLLEQR